MIVGAVDDERTSTASTSALVPGRTPRCFEKSAFSRPLPLPCACGSTKGGPAFGRAGTRSTDR